MNKEIAQLKSEMALLIQIRNSTNIQAVSDEMDAKIVGLKAQMSKLNRNDPIAREIEDIVAKQAAAIDLNALQRYDDLHPRVALKSINGAAFSVIRGLLYLNRVHAAIMAKQATSVSGTSGWKRVAAENTSPYESEEDQLLSISEETKSCVDELAVLYACHGRACDAAIKHGITLNKFDEFPDVTGIIQGDQIRADAKYAEKQALGAAVRAVVPSVISML